MADSNIGSLPQAASLDDDSLLVAEQQGTAVKVTGAQFKEFGRQAVIGQVQGYVNQAEAAANRAVDAVSAVTDMTVEADTLDSGQSATVIKTTKDGKVNLKFGLPRGAQGVPGPEGPPGPKGAKGEKGDGLEIAGRYDTTGDVTNPQEGKSYYIGTQAPYDIYTYLNGEWVNNGPLSGGGGGGPLPENVVTAEGGASMSFPMILGDGPHVITFTEEEEPPLTAEDIAYSDTQSVKDAIDNLKSSVSNGKSLIASAITDKGVDTAQDATFEEMAENIGAISTGSDTADATATSFDILAPKTAYTANGKVEGVIPTLPGQTIIPGTADKTIANGQYLGGTQIIKGDSNLTSSNIKSGVALFGVEGALESTFQATLTVTADIGAVVTATHTSGDKLEGLSTTGTVVLELPLEGTWSVTAVRGAAQYNTVTVNVTSSYNAVLTAEVHIVMYGNADSLAGTKKNLAGTTINKFALFAGGSGAGNGNYSYSTVEYYNNFLVKGSLDSLSEARYWLSAATVGNYALFAGGYELFQDAYFNTVDAYNAELVKSTPAFLSEKRCTCGAATIGQYAIFAGGDKGGAASMTTEAYSKDVVRSTISPLALSAHSPKGTSNQNYAIFCGSGKATAYDQSLVRTNAVAPEGRYYNAARAGNYVLFCGEEICEAYDLFLTKVSVESLYVPRYSMGATTLHDYAIFAGGLGGESLYGNVAVDVYDAYLTHTSSGNLSVSRYNLASASVESFSLFAGGSRYNTPGVKNVDVYQYV